MGWLWPKKLLEWREPQALRRSIDTIQERRVSPWVRPLAFAFIVGLLLVQWAWATSPTKPSFPVALLLGCGLAFFLIYLVPFFLRFLPKYVVVYDNKLMRSGGSNPQIWEYKLIDHCTLSTRKSEAGDISVLTITPTSGEAAMVGIDPKVSLQELHDALTGAGVQVEWENVTQPMTASTDFAPNR